MLSDIFEAKAGSGKNRVTRHINKSKQKYTTMPLTASYSFEDDLELDVWDSPEQSDHTSQGVQDEQRVVEAKVTHLDSVSPQGDSQASCLDEESEEDDPR